MVIKIPSEFDSKFRFILVAAERAKQLQSGIASRIEAKSRKPAYVALREVERGLVAFEILEEDDDRFDEAGQEFEEEEKPE